MADTNIAPAKDNKADGSMAASRRKGAQTPDQQRFTSDERRVLDALEDDEVRESLKASRKLSP
jgi:hypothetical protein